MFDSDVQPGARSHRAAYHLETPQRAAPRRLGRRTIRYAAAAAAAAMLALLWAGIWFHLETIRNHEIAEAETNARNLVRTFEEHMLRTLSAIDQVLLRMRALYAEHPERFDFAREMPEAQAILKVAVGAYVSDADGRVVWSTTGTGQGSYVGDREHFLVHAQSREDRVYVSKPVTGRVSGRPSIQVTRRITRPDGSFGGVVDVALDPAYLDTFYRSIELGPLSTTTVFGLDGIVRARAGREPTRIGQDMRNAPVMNAQRERPEGLLRMDSVFDGRPKIIAYRRLEGFPLVVTVAIAEADALADFHQEQRAVIAAGLMITALIAGLALFLMRQLTRIEHADRALAASEERYQLLVDGSREGMYDRDFTRDTIWFSERVHQFLGLPDGALNGDRSRFLALIHPDDRAGYENDAMRLLAAQECYITTLFRMRHVDGGWRWIESRGRALYAPDGRPVRAVGSFGDVTDHKSAEAALRESHEHLLDAERLGRVGSVAYDKGSGRVFWSDSLFDLLRSPPRDSFSHAEALARIHPDDLPLYEAERNAAVAGRRDFEMDLRVVRYDDTIAWMHMIGHPHFDDAGNYTGLLLVLRDNTDIREAEQALRQSEERYALAVEGMREGLFDRDFKTGTSWYSPRVHELLGLPDGSLNGDRERFASLIHPDDRVPYEAEILRRQANRLIDNVVSFRIRRGDGQWRWIIVRGRALYDEAGMLARTVGSIGDITEQKLAEQALQESEARFRALVEHSTDAYYILTPAGDVLYRSPSASKIFGRIDMDVVGSSIYTRLHADDVEAFAAALRPGSDTPAARRHGMARVRHHDGSWRNVSWSCSDATNIPGIGGMVLNVRDVTDAVSMEAQLRQAQKMEAVGRLAGGIAHDFNNILGAILGFAGLLVEDLADGSPQQDFARRIAKAGDRGKQLVQQILAFSRHRNVEREPTDLGRIVGDVRDLLASSLPASTQLEIVMRDDCLVAEANVGQVTQILLNLCINANDALAGRPGRIAIELADVRPGDPDYAAFRGDAAEGDTQAGARARWGDLDPARAYARLSVTDTGPGMDAELLTRIFDPFFTTKEPGRGTGLGLSVVHGIVLAYDGAGLAFSRSGAGTVFTIYLPLIDAEPCSAQALAPTPKGTGNVLLIDDDHNLAEATAIALERRGYQVVITHDPGKALALFGDTPERWAVVISDQTMPGMTGLGLHARMKAIRQDLRFVLCTGFSNGTVEQAAQAAGIDAVFIKPVPTDRLVDRIRDIIGAAVGAA